MSRYQLEVAELDRRHRLTMKGLSFLGAAVLIVFALWSAGLPPTEWWVRAHGWFENLDKPTHEPTVVQQPQASTPAAVPTNILPPAAEILPGTDSSISATPQQLFLVSTSPGRSHGEGTARIGASIDNPQTYAAGALLANGSRLAEIYRDYVVVTRDDSTAKLQLYRRDITQQVERNPLLLVGGEEERPVAVSLSREVLTDYLRPSPVYDGETLQGYQVYPGPKAGVFRQLGLEPGDVVISIDDSPLTDPSQAMEMFNQLVRGVAVIASVQRKGAARRITLDGALISADQENAGNPAAQLTQPLGMPAT